MKILLVEDDWAIRKTLCSVLKDLKHEVAVAEEAEAALKLARYSFFDTLLTDNQMPNMTGVQLVNELRDKGICPDKVIIMSANDIDNLPKEVIFLKKTFSLEKLEQILKGTD